MFGYTQFVAYEQEMDSHELRHVIKHTRDVVFDEIIPRFNAADMVSYIYKEL